MEKINYIFGLIAFLIIIAGAILVAVSFDEEENSAAEGTFKSKALLLNF